METNMNINLPEDFTILCSIYQIKPETFIQSFVDQVSFPCFYSRPHGTDRWATFFFLYFLDVEESKYEVNGELEDEYLQKFTDALKQHFYPNTYDEAKAEEIGRAVMRQWMKAAMADRTKYIIDNL
jgi:hypothetical protein